MSKEFSQIKFYPQSQIYKIDGDAIDQKDQEFLNDIEKNDNSVIQKEVDSFLDTFFERQKFMKENDLKQLNKIFEPIMNKIQKSITTFCYREDAPSFNKYFGSSDQSERIIIKPKLNDFDLFVQKIYLNTIENEQRNIDQVVIEIENQNPIKKLEEKKQIQKPLDPLNKYQIQSIKKEGRFTVFKQEGIETWGVKESFFISQQSQNHAYQQTIQKYTNDIKEQFIDSESTWRRYRTNEWENMQFSKQYINLYDSLITFYHIPVHLLNALIGIPLKRVEYQRCLKLSQINQMINESKLKRETQNYDLLIEKLVQKLIDNPTLTQINMPSILYNCVRNLQWNKQLYQELQYLKLFLLLQTNEQFLIEIAEAEGLQEEFKQFLRDFRAYQIVKYFKRRIRNELQFNKDSVCDCIYFIKKYNLHQGYENQYFKILKIFEESNNLKPKKQETIEYYNQNNTNRSTYFWKLKYYWKIQEDCFNQLDSVADAIVNGPFGLVAFFSCKKEAHSKVVVSKVIYEEYHKTFSQMFREVKQQIEQNKKKFLQSQENVDDNDDDDGGIFGECCERFNCGFYIRNYVCLYFFKGIIFISILLRFVSIAYILFLSSAYILLCLLSLFFIIFQVMCTVFVFDYSNPRNEREEMNLVYPNFCPLLQIFVIYPFCGLIKMIISLSALLYCYTVDFFIYLRYLPLNLKNFFTLLLIRIYGQVPEKNSRNCILLSQNNKLEPSELSYKRNYQYINCYLSFEQIKILIKQELNIARVKVLQQNLIHVISKRIAENKKQMENLENYLPFPKKSNKIIQTFEKELDQFQQQQQKIFNKFYYYSYQIDLKTNQQFFYEKEELNLLQNQIIDYLKQLSNQDQNFQQNFSTLNINLNDYNTLSKYLITQIFKNHVKCKEKTFETVYHKLTEFPIQKQQNLKDIYTEAINDYLEKNYCQTIQLFQDSDLDIKSMLIKFNKWNKQEKYFK